MAKGKKTHAATVPETKEVASSKNNLKTSSLLLVFAICIVTVLAYLKGFSPEKEFTNWDDLGYVVEQPLTKTTNPDSVALLYQPSTQVMLNYHPLTMLTLRYNYQQSALDIQPYFKTNLLLHVCNTVFVFLLLLQLGNRSLFIAGFGALFFGIHPMHVESVAWISERKDVLYTFFFLLALLSYIRYVKKENLLWLVLTFVLFIASCLSKAMAVPLPIVLLLLDYFYQRKFSVKSILEKVPFFALAVWIGWNAVQIQANGAIAEYEIFSTFERFMFASYGFIMYWVKFFVPIELAAFYPYPTFDAQHGLPFFFYLAPFIAIALSLGSIFAVYKFKKEWLRTYIFGFGFFVVMIALVLQFISVGSAIMADRYAYIPYIGASFMILWMLEKSVFLSKNKTLLIGALGVYSLFLFAQAYKMTGVWTNSETLWSNVIELYPYQIERVGNIVHVKKTGVEVAYKNRGNYYREHNRMDLAFKDYNVLVDARVKDALVYSNMGNMYALENKFDASIEMYKLALERDKNSFDVYLNRGITYAKMGKHVEAIADYEQALRIQKNDIRAMSNICSELLNAQRYDETLKYAQLLIKAVPNGSDGYFYRGTVYVNQQKFDLAVIDLEKSISLRPDYPYAWFNCSIAYKSLNQRAKALEYAEKAKSFGIPVSEEYLNSLR